MTSHLQVTKEKVILDTATLFFDEIVLCSGYQWNLSDKVDASLQIPINLKLDPNIYSTVNELLIIGEGIISFPSPFF